MTIRLVLLALTLLPFVDDGSREGRRGNAHYEMGQFEQAVEQYRLGLAAVEEGTRGPIPAGLANNLGAALHRLGQYEDALRAFTQSVLVATTDDALVRAAYNTGNNAAALGDTEFALAAYREALLTDPSNEDAKYNYELLKRQQQEQQNGQGEDNPDEDESEGDEQQGEGEQDPGEGEQNQEQQGDQEQNQDQQSQPQQPEDGQQEQQQPQQPGDRESELSREQAERILQALQTEEEQLLREVQKMDVRPRRVEKDW